MGPACFQIGMVHHPVETCTSPTPYTCYCAKFGWSKSNLIGVGRGH